MVDETGGGVVVGRGARVVVVGETGFGLDAVGAGCGRDVVTGRVGGTTGVVETVAGARAVVVVTTTGRVVVVVDGLASAPDVVVVVVPTCSGLRLLGGVW